MLLLLNILHAVRVILSDAKDGFVEISRNGLALVGLVVVTIALILSARPELQESATARVLGWLESRQLAAVWSPTSGYAALERTTAGDPLDLPAEQASVTYWLSRKYSISPEPMSVLVAEAFQLGPASPNRCVKPAGKMQPCVKCAVRRLPNPTPFRSETASSGRGLGYT